MTKLTKKKSRKLNRISKTAACKCVEMQLIGVALFLKFSSGVSARFRGSFWELRIRKKFVGKRYLVLSWVLQIYVIRCLTFSLRKVFLQKVFLVDIMTYQLKWPSGERVCLWSCRLGLIASPVKPMTLKLLFTASLLDAQH